MNPRTMLLGKRTSRLAGRSLRAAGWVCLCAPALSAQFENVTTAAGLTDSTAYCFGAAWGDCNQDGFPDLFIAAGANGSHTNSLYLNLGNSTFAKAGPAAGPIVTNKLTSFGGAWVDCNQDGRPELIVLNGGWSPARSDLYWNHGDGTFGRGSAGDLTRRAIVTSGPAFADYDGDGWVDLYLAEATSGTGPFQPRLHRATGHGTFTPVDLGPAITYANSAVWGDYDNDGDPDLFTCNYTTASSLWRNDGHGQFTKMTNGLPASASTAHAAWADYDHDGDLDIALSSLNDTRLYRNGGPDGFMLATTLAGARGMPAWADYNNDGHPDLVAVGGQNTPERTALYHNNGDGTFTRATDVFTEVADYCLGCPWGDFDNDGFMDLLLTHQHGRNRLFHNLRNANHWLKFSLEGKVSNRDAIGAKVRVLATIRGQAVWQMQEVNGGYAIQNDLRPNFGLGDATQASRVRIEWPSGNVQELTDVAADQIVSVTELAAITPFRPSASLNGAVMLRRAGTTAISWQWRFEGVDLAGQTHASLMLMNLTAAQAGRYSVVVDTGTEVVTNHTCLVVDPEFAKITTGPVATDHVISWSGSWGDSDGDGLLDLVVLGDYFNLGPNTRLYHNDGQGRFSAVLSGPWAALNDRILCSPWADTDNDGDLDLFLTGYEGNAPIFMQNEGEGAFTRRTVDKSWTSSQIQVRGWANAWADFDNDGLLDAALIEYRVYPMRNNGDGTFTVLTESPIYKQGGSTHSVQWVDYDGDGDQDLFVVFDLNPSRLYRNDGDNQFTDVSSSAMPPQKPLGQGFNAGWGDFDNDGDLDLYFMSYQGAERFLVNNGDGTFANWAGSPAALLTELGDGGAVWGDYDNDGYLDLFLARDGGPSRLFRNQGDGNFVEVTIGDLITTHGRTQSASWADYNNDGTLDLFVAGLQASGNYLYQNNGNGNHWLKLRLRGTASNSHAIGARVLAQATLSGKPVRQMRTITAHAMGQELEAHFGLAEATRVTKLRIEWPSGTVQEFSNVPADQILTLWEPPVLKAAMPAGGASQLDIRAEPNRSWQVQASSDLGVWTTLTTVTNTTVGFQYTDATAVGVGTRFYRLVSE